MLGAVSPALDSLRGSFPLHTRQLGLAFSDTTNSYKFAWFLGILSRMERAPTLRETPVRGPEQSS